MAKPDDPQTPVHLTAAPGSDGALKGILLLIALLVVGLLWIGIPVHLTVAGVQGREIPLFVGGLQQQSQVPQWEMQTVTRPNGATFITRLNRASGSVSVLMLDDNGKLTPIDSQQ